MSARGTIPSDFPCKRCGYNLRGLPSEGRCPECGGHFLYLLTVNGAADSLREYYAPLARDLGYSVDAVIFVVHAYQWQVHDTDAESQHLDTAQFCEAVKLYAIHSFDDSDGARELLSEWGIRRSEDVSTIAYGLVEAGV